MRRSHLRNAARPVPRRLAERAVGVFFRAATRMGGLRPSLVPSHLRRQLHVIGVNDSDLARVLRNIHSLADWPYAWEAEGDRRAAAGDWFDAAAAYYCGQRPLLTDSPLKRRLYRLVTDAYERVDQAPLEHLRITSDSSGETIAGYLQLPPRREPSKPLPLLLIVPGVTSTKEEMHPFVEPFLRRGYAVARIDNPGYGDTTGIVTAHTGRYPVEVLQFLALDDRIDAGDMHLFGTSLGAHWVLHSCVNSPARSAVVVSPPYMPEHYFTQLPSMNHTALAHMTGLEGSHELYEFCRSLNLRDTAPRIDIPVKIFHGGRDRTIPRAEAFRLADHLAGPTAVTIWERDHHICLEHIDEMIAETLEWIADPIPVARAWQLQRSNQLAEESRRARMIDDAITATASGDELPEPGVA